MHQEMFNEGFNINHPSYLQQQQSQVSMHQQQDYQTQNIFNHHQNMSFDGFTQL